MSVAWYNPFRILTPNYRNDSCTSSAILNPTPPSPALSSNTHTVSDVILVLALIAHFNNSDSIREKMKKNYMSNPSYNYEQVNRASLACGPMVKWAIAQVWDTSAYFFWSRLFQESFKVLFIVLSNGWLC